MKIKLKIFIATHKIYDFPKSSLIYEPIFVGKKENGFLADNTGDNISDKNKNYCELTALYWIWKNNLNLDYVGLVHYRRYFNFKSKKSNLPSKKLEKILDCETSSQKILNILERKEYDIILPKKKKLGMTVEKHYNYFHSKKDFEILKNVISIKYPEYQNELDLLLLEKEIYAFNMFISSAEIFSRYMEWLFDILFEVEKQIEISENPYQARVFGFMSERLLNLYIKKNKLKVLEIPYTMLHDSKLSEIKYRSLDLKGVIKNKIKNKFKK